VTHTFDWIEIRTHDMESTAAFYESLFGWRITDRQTADGLDVWILDTGGEPRVENLRRGGIWLRPKGEPLGFVVYVLVDDIEATLEHVTQLGGEVVGRRIPVGAGHAAYFTDPSGNLVALYEERKPG
jgi:uncharacterized protein